jgi:very-short-patch-repair endonuclease
MAKVAEVCPPLAGVGGGMKADKNNLCDYNKSLQPFANKLRKEMTKAEACLWKYVLRAGQMKGYQFRRQRPVLNYIADFMCKELRLVIEVDGITHDSKLEKDKCRTEELWRAGFHVIRFTDEEVLTNIQGVAREIERVIKDIEPPPAPPPAGDNSGR